MPLPCDLGSRLRAQCASKEQKDQGHPVAVSSAAVTVGGKGREGSLIKGFGWGQTEKAPCSILGSKDTSKWLWI